jgi:hypothetical protein
MIAGNHPVERILGLPVKRISGQQLILTAVISGGLKPAMDEKNDLRPGVYITHVSTYR